MPVVRFVDAHHLLHCFRGQTYFVADHPGAVVETRPDVDQLDLIGVDYVDFGMSGSQRGDRFPGALSISEAGCEFGTDGAAQHSPVPIVGGASSGRTARFYNVF